MAELPSGVRGHTYTVKITIFLGGGEAGHFREKAPTPQIP